MKRYISLEKKLYTCICCMLAAILIGTIGCGAVAEVFPAVPPTTAVADVQQ